MRSRETCLLARSRMLPVGTWGLVRDPSGRNWKWRSMRVESKVSRGEGMRTSPNAISLNM